MEQNGAEQNGMERNKTEFNEWKSLETSAFILIIFHSHRHVGSYYIDFAKFHNHESQATSEFPMSWIHRN